MMALKLAGLVLSLVGVILALVVLISRNNGGGTPPGRNAS